MANKPKCIFHIPNYIDPNGTSGSQVRPMKMLEAFRGIGYDVDVVMGYGKERKESIKKIKEAIRKGEKYDFLYSESSTMPTLLTEKNHLPIYPFLDFGFFDFCKKNGISIGLFYRDIHWKFAHYMSNLPLHKKIVTVPMYYYDLKCYKKYLDVFYLPSDSIGKYVKNVTKKVVTDILPPGAEQRKREVQSYQEVNKKAGLNIFYVGGVTGVYEFENLFKVASRKSYVNLTICCREGEWLSVKSRFSKYMTDRINIVHRTGEELEPFYCAADICSCYFAPNIYANMSIPIKLLEYIGHQVPVIVAAGTEAGKFVEKYKCGFSIPYGENEIEQLLDKVYANKGLLLEKYENVKSCFNENTWEIRAKKVASDLSR